MNFINSMNQRVSKLSLLDIQFIKAGNWFFALIIELLSRVVYERIRRRSEFPQYRRQI